ncbi:MAG: LysR family transcriptional regulator [Pseudomonadota bacterium]
MPRKQIGEETTLEMLKAFVTLADTLNLTETSTELSATRQTVRRHISHLEEIKGGALFTLSKNTYVLTPIGEAALPDARHILRQAERWSDPRVGSDTESVYLEAIRFVDDEGREFLSQQHPVSAISKLGSPLLRTALAAWANGAAQLESDVAAPIRPYLVIYRRDPRGWLCVEIGEKSAYARWFGWTWSKSAVGRLSYEDRAGDDFDAMVSDAYSKVHGEGTVRLDHLYAHLPRETSGRPEPVTFQRLLMTFALPDLTPVLAVLVVITDQVEINLLDPATQIEIPREVDMQFEQQSGENTPNF